MAEYMGLAERVRESDRELEAYQRIVSVRVDLIDPSPYQTRVDFDDEELNALAEDIKATGLSQPVTLRAKHDGRYELVAGERRWRAAQVAGMETIEARVRELDDFTAHLIGVSENNQRANLSPWEKALEALELQQHARSSGRPHAQRDLARYLNRNVSVVNQQLAIARALPVDAPDWANVTARDVCQLPHETLHRIARLPPPERSAALADAIGSQQARKPAAVAHEPANASPAPLDEPMDRWTRLWEHGGLQLHIRKPFRDLDPAKTRSYIEDLMPGIGALATRAAQEDGRSPLLHWDDERGRLLFVPPAGRLDAEERQANAFADLPDGGERTAVVNTIFAGPGYLEALGMRLVDGRVFERGDLQPDTPGAVVSRSLAEELWPGVQALGRRVRPLMTDYPWHTVVGIVEDARTEDITRAPVPTIYFPYSDVFWARSLSFTLRTEGPPAALTPAVRRAVWELDPNVPVSSVATMRALFAGHVSRTTFTLTLVGVAAAIALLLGAVGIYGVIAYAVDQRRLEIGVRMALGARAPQVVAMVLGQTLALALAGIAVGLALSVAATRLLGSLLFEVAPTDPLTLASVAAALAAVAALAGALPARRATRVDAVVALRQE